MDVRIWDPNSGDCLMTLREGFGVTALSVLSNGNLAIASFSSEYTLPGVSFSSVYIYQ
jgi:hypothetical protein